MDKGKYILSAFLTLVILTSSLYFVLNEEVRVDITKTRSIFKVLEDGKWVVSGIEYTNIFDGTAKMRAKNRSLDTEIGDDNITIVTRIANYKEEISTIEIYTFDPGSSDLELFPISHSIQVINADRPSRPFILQYEVQKLLYTEETVWNVPSPQSFGRKMKVEWETGNYYSRIYKYKGRDEGKLTVKYRIDSNDYNKNVRLFDPIDTVTLNSPDDNYYSPVTNVTFNCSASTTGGSILSNISLYSNSSGTWGLNETYSNFGDGKSYIYDEINDSSINASLWDTAVGGHQATISEDTDKISLSGGSTAGHEVGTSSETLTSNNFPSDLSTITNITMKVSVGVSSDSYSGGIGRFTLFGNTIKQLTSGDQGDTSVWTFVQNTSNNSQYDVYDDDVYINTITPSGNEIQLYAYQTKVASSLWSFGSASLYYVYYKETASTTTTQTFTKNISSSNLWNCEACDNTTDCNFAAANRTVYLDEQNPLVSIVYPTATNYTTNISELNYSASDSNPDKCWYSTDNGTSNSSVVDYNTNFTNVVSTEGWNTWTVYCNDTIGYEDSSNVTFWKDTTLPLIEYSANSDTSNSSGDFTTKDWIWINVTVDEISVDNVTFWTWTSLNSTFNKTTVTNQASIYTLNQTNLDKDVYFYNVTVCDWFGNCNTTDRRYYGDEVINLSIDSLWVNQDVELGGDLNISATSTYDYVFIDVDHPSYGTNYSSGKWSTTFELLIDWFRNTLFSDGNTSKEFNFTAGFGTDENKTFNLSSHQYDEIVNVSFNISGTNAPFGVAFYNVNDTDYDRVFYGNLTGSYVWQDRLVDKGHTPYGYNKTQNLSFDNEGEQFLYFYMDDNAKLVNFLLNVTSSEYGFDFSSNLFPHNYTDTVLTTARNKLGTIIPGGENLYTRTIDDFEDASINSTKWGVSADDSGTQCESAGQCYTYTRANSEESGYLKMRLYGSEAVSNESQVDLSVNNLLYSQIPETQILSTEDYILNFSISVTGEEKEQQELCDAYNRIYLHGETELIYELGLSYFCTDTDSYCSEYAETVGNLIINISYYNETHYKLLINGTDRERGDSGLCNSYTVTRYWDEGRTEEIWDDCPSYDVNTSLTNPTYITFDVTSFTETFKLKQRIEGEYSEIPTENPCSGNGLIYKTAEHKVIGPCSAATSEWRCDGPYGYFTGSCTWDSDPDLGYTNGCKSIENIFYLNNVDETRYELKNSSYYSTDIFDSSADITELKMLITTSYSGSAENNSFTIDISADSGSNYQNIIENVTTPVLVPGKHLRWLTEFGINTPRAVYPPLLSDIQLFREKSNISNVNFDVGDDGTYEASIDGNFTSDNGTVQVNLSSASLLNAFTGTAITGHTHYLKVVVNSNSAGQLNIEWINLTYDPNPVYLTVSYIQDFLTSFGNLVTDFIVMFDGSGDNSQVNISDIKFDYAGGNETYTITAHNNDSSVSLDRNVTFYYSYWDYAWVPEDVEWIFFNPLSPTSKNITAYGQTDSIPILNVTNYGYGGRNTTLSVYVNDTLDCVNITLSLDNNKSNGYVLNSSWIELSNMSYLDTVDVYLFADYDCSYTNWRLFNPYLSFRQSCIGCISSEVVV